MSDPDWTKNHARPNVAAGVLFTDEQDRVLMVVPSYKDYLDIPGGYVENGETPHQAAQREVFEELGITPPIGRLLVADWWAESPETNLGPKLLLVFDGGTLSREQLDSVIVDGREVLKYRLCALDEIDSITIPRLAGRLRRALSCQKESLVSYMENGISPL